MNEADKIDPTERAQRTLMHAMRQVTETLAAEFFGPDTGVILIVSHDHPDDGDAGRVRVVTNIGGEIAARLMFELSTEYARDRGVDLSGERQFVEVDAPNEVRP